jgi:hypothetical protein
MNKLYFILCFLCLRSVLIAQNCMPTNQCFNAPLFCGRALETQIFNNFGSNGAFSPNCNDNFVSHASSWFKVIPCTNSLELTVTALNTLNGNGLQIALYTGCSPNLAVACNAGMAGGWSSPLTFTATVVPGKEYLLQVDGYDGDICEFTIDVISGIDTAVPPPPISTVPGAITSIPNGNSFCTVGAVSFKAEWPGCALFTTPQLTCYKPKEDSCKGIKWTFPPGTIYLSAKDANPVLVSFVNVVPGNDTIRAKPKDCACPKDLCVSCGQLCCPVEELFFPINIRPTTVIQLPTIELCATQWPPTCVQSTGSFSNDNNAFCQISLDVPTCTQVVQPYHKIPADTTNLGIIMICAGDSVAICDTFFTDLGPHTYFCSCDSAVTFNIVKDFSCNNDCLSYNQPAPMGNAVATAPFLCGNYLDGYCSSNTDLNGGLSNIGIPNTGILRFSPCSTDPVSLKITVKDCYENAGLTVQVTDKFFNQLSVIIIDNNDTDTLITTGLIADTSYLLLVSSAYFTNDICAFQIEVLGGIGTGEPGGATCSCTDSYVTGPTDICPADIVQYSIVPGSCTFGFTPGTAGNGYYCCPDGINSTDTLKLVWHIPPFMNFLSDSIDVTTITVQVDSSFLGMNVDVMDSVWVSLEHIPTNPSPPSDTLVFCDCTAGGCISGFKGKGVHMMHKVEQFNCTLTCSNNVCVLNGIVFNQPGVTINTTNCLTKIYNISKDVAPPTVAVLSQGFISCYQPVIPINPVIGNMNFVIAWTGPFGQPQNPVYPLYVSQPGTYSCTVTNPSNGCTSKAEVFVAMDITPPIAVAGPKTTICNGQSVTLSTAGSSSGGQFIYKWNTPLPPAAVTPLVTTTYTLTVTNNFNGCTKTATTTITVKPITVVNHALEQICAENWPPTCPNGGATTVNGSTATCSVLSGLPQCEQHIYNYQRLNSIVVNQNIPLCSNDTFWLNGSPHTQINSVLTDILTSALGCDSMVNYTLVQNPNCPILFDCPNANMPAPPGDSCHLAPFLCGNYLNNYCTNTSGLTNDLVDGVLIPQAGFIRFSSCEDSVHLQMNVGDCTEQDAGVQFWLLTGDCTNPDLSQPITVLEGQSGQFIFNGLTPDEPYFIVFGNANSTADNVCPFNIEVVSGVGTATPGPSTCTCTGTASILGPSVLCPTDVANYTLILPSCDITFGVGSGGNGSFCCPSLATDSVHIQWHLPLGLNFLSDSINVYSIQVQADSSMLGLDTVLVGEIFVTINTGSGTDTLVFCDCTASCAFDIMPKEVTIMHTVEYLFCMFTCVSPSCILNGEAYLFPGSFMQQTNCKTTIVNIFDDTSIPTVEIMSSGPACYGGVENLFAITNANYSVTWSGPGVNGLTGLSVSAIQPGVYAATVTGSNGCTNEASYTVVFPPPVIAATSPDITICVGESTTLSATGSLGGNFYQWSNSQTGFTITVTPATTTTYTVTVFNDLGCTATASVTVTVDPLALVNMGQVGLVSCSTPCFTFQGKNYCNPGQYQDTTNCTIHQFSIAFAKDTIYAGNVATFTCAQACAIYQGQSYCQAGNYTSSNSCTVYFFSINANTAPPTHAPQSHTCLPGNNSYAVGFPITGTPPYKVNGTLISGSYYLSEPVLNGQTYTFIVEQTINGCQDLVTGSFDCAFMCTAGPATMQINTGHTCVDEPITAQVLSPAQLSNTDTAEFVLHTLPGTSLGTVLSKNSSGIFIFNSNTMIPGTTYYISSMAGPKDATGQIDLSSACTSISEGQPVVFDPLPFWEKIVAQDPTCFDKNDGIVALEGIIGATPWNISLNNGQPNGLSKFENLSAGIYTLTLIDNNGCTDAATVTLAQPDSIWLNVSDSRDVKINEMVLLQAQTNIDYTPVWTNLATQEQYVGIEWLVQIQDTTQFQCIVTNDNGCTAFAAVTLRLASEGLYHPNVISLQDANPVNQWFTIFTAPDYARQIVYLDIFDRWGNKVFERQQFDAGVPELGWNGNVRGKQVDPAVYTFAAQVLLRDGTVKNIVGDVTVVR